MNLSEMLRAQESKFDVECNLLASVWNSPGYHSRIPSGSRIHSTRTNIYYALALLEEGDPAMRPRACDVIRRVLTSQVTDPYDPAYGIWPWHDEEPVSEMAPPDWNWADFIGSGLCHILKDHREELREPLAGDVSAALERAAWSIFRRNVQPNYTNIAIMGAAVTGCAGELLDIPLLREYALSRLRHFVSYTHDQGGLNEYNSPTYTFVALFEVERILQLVESPALRQVAEGLHEIIWAELAKKFHPATGQLGGAQSRAYAEYLPAGAAQFLEEATGVPIRFVDEAEEAGLLEFRYDGVRHLPCPERFRSRFAAVPEGARELTQCYVKRATPEKDFTGTTCLTPEFALGSVNRECFWAQRRPLQGYWPDGEGKPAMFRMRFFKDGRDFAAAGIRMVQSENKVLFACGMLTDRGDFHIGLDRPKDSIYSFRKLALRFELAAASASLADARTLAAGEFKVVIHELPGTFDGMPVRWQSGADADRVWLEAVLYDGEEKSRAFDETLKTVVGGGVELLPRAAEPSEEPTIKVSGDRVKLEWGSLKLSAPSYAESYD